MGNVKASELRQGNIINVLYSSLARPSMEPRIMQAIVRGTDDKTVITDCAGVPNEDKCSGIPLTEDWLRRFGFKFREERGRKTQAFIGDNPVTHDWLFDIKIVYDYWFYRNGHHRIDYVHQLQNLYFCLCGKELELKTNDNAQ